MAPPANPDAPHAYVIRDDAEALAVAAGLAAEFAVDAAERDATRRLPRAELDRLSDSGLLAITVPAEHGGADVSAATIAEVFRLLAAADPNIAQIPHSHFVYVNVLRHQGDPEQRKFFFGEILAGKRIGNAQSEIGTKNLMDYRTRLTPVEGGGYLVNGTKYYATGALFAHWIAILARGEDDKLYVAYAPADDPGITVVDDWAGMGQRTTASGTVHLLDVAVPDDRVVPQHRTFDGPQLYGAFAQVLHAAIDVGIAEGALDEAAHFVRTKTRPWFEAGVETAVEDPLLVQRFGELSLELRAAHALLTTAAREIDTAAAALDDDSAGRASLAVAAAKAYSDRAANSLAGALFEVAGTRSSLDTFNLHRHWRNARTHTLHDPVRWKVQHLGRAALTGTLPPRHGLL
ncbi:SfnB family sulfur acquisition oxidoreductase [Allocatelliglobosispora scoriae]|uniref:SfnB family sulfur acquisition oxidoreductase n=1 Tax=Allocatelliglobosispora scoriae TaxID=643052 RepID=A0A841BN18_9ACTN|nr:SfnB family sulfur acquisition oxidoreductase [Allocatelliglobosispora scoriae]MBB5868231.1 SfnB family sulfur acquisition oxidoreductase [Allocatelliglobosispora scoriae]